MTLRPYQQAASDAALEWMKGSIEPACIEAVTAAGKSHVIADMAYRIHAMTGKKVLCLAPSAELVTQNRLKFLATGHPASMFSASAGGKDLRHPVVFGSPLTVKNRISAFQDGYAMVVIDECHGINATVQAIIEAMRIGNPNLRVMGLTATPYRLGSGYIFRQWPDGKINTDETCREPYFTRCVYRITGPELIEQGFLTPPVIGEVGAEGYDTSALIPNGMGKFDAGAVDRAYHGHGRKTSAIVSDIVSRSTGRRGVMLFAATVRHAQEVMDSLPPELSAMVTGETPAKERREILEKFKDQRIKYLVNVAVLTTGFDAPHVDVISILRKTESVGLLQQIVGRGLRLNPGKVDCLVLDYTTNLDDHCPDGDIFAPAVRAGKGAGAGGMLRAVCPDCGCENEFSAKPDTLDHEKDSAGYCVDLDGSRIETEWGPMPGHHGRRCFGLVKAPGGVYDRCGYRWTSKPCPECEEPNDIAARYCCACRAELVDPNERLKAEFRAMKRDPSKMQTDVVVDVVFRDTVSQKGRSQITANWTTPFRKFTTWHDPNPTFSKAIAAWRIFSDGTDRGTRQPKTVTYAKEQSGFYRIFAFDKEPDHEPA